MGETGNVKEEEQHVCSLRRNKNNDKKEKLIKLALRNPKFNQRFKASSKGVNFHGVTQTTALRLGCLHKFFCFFLFGELVVCFHANVNETRRLQFTVNTTENRGTESIRLGDDQQRLSRSWTHLDNKYESILPGPIHNSRGHNASHKRLCTKASRTTAFFYDSNSSQQKRLQKRNKNQ